MRSHSFYALCAALLIAVSVAGCHTAVQTDPVTYTNAIALSVTHMPLNRPGETYALWLGFNKAAAGQKSPAPLNSGTTVYRFISRFTVDAGGRVIGLDTSNFVSKLGIYSLANAEQADISVESASTINDTLPAALMMASNFSGTTHQGVSTPNVTDNGAFGYTFSPLEGGFTLTPGASGGTSVYLMSATSAANPSQSLQDLSPLPNVWRYALWVVDTTSSASLTHLFGTFANATGYSSDSSGSMYRYPGGELASADLRSSGNAQVLVTLEPGTLGANPSKPFGIVLLRATIAKNTPLFSPVALTNVSAPLPTATVLVNR